jgi:hypothetical protein
MEDLMNVKHVVKPLIAGAFVFAAAGLFGQTGETALVRELIGTVEMRAPGGTEWEPVRSGQRLPVDTVISTGFRSTVNLVLGDSVLTVRPLTRIAIAGISRRREGDRVDLNLRAGRIRADVKPPPGGTLDFSVRSPIATASVRGTVFELDTLNLFVSEGTVEFTGTSGAAVLVDSGGSSFVDGAAGRPVSPAETAAAELRPELPAGAGTAIPVNEPAAGGLAAQTPSSELGVTVTF